jgi:hypothetical protein
MVPIYDNKEAERITDWDIGLTKTQAFKSQLNMHSQSGVNWDFGATAAVEAD